MVKITIFGSLIFRWKVLSSVSMTMSLEELSKEYLELPEDTSITCEKNLASGSIAIGGESHFYPGSILEQFERLMKLIKFKRKYEGHASH